ncbi:zinc finger protein, putative [Ixodes scapularis]|uniref:Zinc finger CCCH-type with G patch domain-containing protein n=1 Tax=Ixodes scapularis TaxID=6945 RepID=B7P636_IXOSC|nr:zinc finger protein, putative [Ixodes scapularis]|eukprot:XP_002408356.1 zinc finger protein, putative [Ixodes scapularis]
MDTNELYALEESLKQYEQQLQAVHIALESSDDAQASDLLELKQNLEEVICLTKTTHAQNPATEATEGRRSLDDSSQSIDDEFARFQAEIAGLGGTSGPADVAGSAAEEDHSKELAELTDHLEGSKVRAPYSKDWGQMEYHNAIVLSVEAADIAHVDDIRVNVMFTHPTTPSMKPCSFFLEGHCKFSAERCRFSHGHAVPLSDLQEYAEPSFSSMQLGSTCLIRNDSDGLWQLATVDSDQASTLSKSSAGKIMVRLSRSGKAISVAAEDVLPLGDYGGAEDSDSDSDLDLSTEDGPSEMCLPPSEASEEDASVPVIAWMPNESASFPLGLWEKHTKGIGSKLMEKMGYVWGEGLGIRGNGRTEPVEAVILPAGKSLDKCMELREKGLTQNSAKVQRKMLLKLQRQEEKLQRQYHKASKPESVFDFFNGHIFSKKHNKGSGAQSLLAEEKSASQDIKSTSSKGLSVEVCLGPIRQPRLSWLLIGTKSLFFFFFCRDKLMHAKVEKKIEEQRQLIRQLQSRERSIQAEQQHRMGNDKLRIF